MKTADQLEHAWRVMEAGTGNERLMRSLEDLGVPNAQMMLALEEGCRELMFPAAPDFTLTNLRPTRGVKVVVRTVARSTGSQRYLVLRCTNSEFHDVFRRFAAAVLEQAVKSSAPAETALEAIRSWQEMFNRAGAKSVEVLLGLYGELHELAFLAKQSAKAVHSWTGPLARPQDFICGRRAMEVKTARGHASEVEIHGLEQLWRAPYEQLVLAVKQVVIDVAGQPLSDLVEELLSYGVDSSTLYEQLELFDLDAQQMRSPDLPRFAHRDSRYFLVTEAAPSLTPDSLRAPLAAGISRLRYRVALDAPGFVELSTDEVTQFKERLIAP